MSSGVEIPSYTVINFSTNGSSLFMQWLLAMACFHLLQSGSDVAFIAQIRYRYDTTLSFLLLGYILACDSYFDDLITIYYLS